MRREPGRRRRDRPGAGRPRAGLARAALRAAARLLTTGFAVTRVANTRVTITRVAITRVAITGFAITGFAVTGLLAGCGSPAPGTFHPSGRAASAAGAGNAGPSHNGLAWPPFGANVHIVMPGWRPADASQIPAVIAAQNFLLAFLYAEYRGNQDDRWTGYASGRVMSALTSNLQAPDVITESFTGTIIFSHMTAFADPTMKGAIDVSECFNNARSANISLATGKVIPDQAPANQHYYRNTDVMAQSHGRWQLVSVYPVVYYPQAKECKP